MLFRSEAGARAYVTKNGDPRDFVEAVKEVARGEVWLPPDLARKLAFAGAEGANPLSRLTPREMEIMRLVARGENLSQVAHALGVSYKTVANSCALIKAKLGVRTTADLVRERPHLTLLREPELSNVLFRREGWEPGDYERWSSTLLESQRAFVQPTRWDGETVGRLSFLHPATTTEMVVEILDAMS